MQFIHPFLLLCLFIFGIQLTANEKPNIVYILMDDLGYGDLRCLNPNGKIPTPNLDRMASQGMIFTDAHSASSVCTPTRYGLLTGRYAWRTWLQKGVVGGYSPALIEDGRMTVASLLKDNGYHTAMIGKSHLGMDWTQKDGTKVEPDYKRKKRILHEIGTVDFTKPIERTPNANGFEYFFGISASLDMPPYVWIENNRVLEQPNRMNRSYGPTFMREGWTSPDFTAVDVMPRMVRRASQYIINHADNEKPFFLYVPLPAPHTPILPTTEYIGQSNTSLYGDFVMMVDAMVGRILETIDNSGIGDHTLVIFTADNGCSHTADFKTLERFEHYPSYIFRGSKSDIYEGGHRIPFIARWPAKIPAGSKSAQLTCLNDLMATCADLINVDLPDNAAEDSFSILPAILNQPMPEERPAVVHHSINGSFAIRKGDWKLALCPGSGGWGHPKPAQTQGLPPVQLYNLKKDIGEQKNLQDEHPEIVAALTKEMKRFIALGRSTPGQPQKNAVEIDLYKQRH